MLFKEFECEISSPAVDLDRSTAGLSVHAGEFPYYGVIDFRKGVKRHMRTLRI